MAQTIQEEASRFLFSSPATFSSIFFASSSYLASEVRLERLLFRAIERAGAAGELADCDKELAELSKRCPIAMLLHDMAFSHDMYRMFQSVTCLVLTCYVARSENMQ